jgi:hypothetical protein
MAIECHNPYIKNKVYWIVFPTKTQAKDAIWKDPNMLFRVFTPQMIERQNEVEMTLYLKSGSVLILKGADDPDSLRGSGPYGIGFDEFDDMKDMVWGITEPIIRANGGWAWFLGTPKGKQNLWNLHQRALSGDPDWNSHLLKASTSKVIPDDELEALRKSMSQALFNQELECEFLEGEASVFRGVREIMTSEPEEPQEGHNYVIGCDLAKVKDYTVLTVYDRSTNKQVYQNRFNTIEWPFQKQKIRAIAEHYNNALVKIDATGIGDPIADDLLRAGVAVEPFKFTQESKKDIIEKLSIWIEQKKIEMLPIEETAFEFDNFAYEILPGGKLKYSAPNGYNDDIVMSHALAVSSLQPIFKINKTQPSPIRQEYVRAIRTLERDQNSEYEGI